MSDYNGYRAAGIFSTDNAQSDQMQIEAEQYVEEEQGQPDDDHEEVNDFDESEFEDGIIEEEWKPVMAIAGSVECPWFDISDILGITLEEYEELVQAKHKEECGCSATLIVSLL